MRCPCARQRQRHDHPLYRMMTEFNPLPELDRLKQLFYYDADTGLFIRKIPRGSSTAGAIAGCKTRRGYIAMCVDGVVYLAHRLAWLYVTSEDPRQWIVDHSNGNPTDNRFQNLRICTNAGNTQNACRQKNNKSGFKGVSFDAERKQWRASIRANNVYKHLGRYQTAQEAHRAYCKAAAELHGEFARTA